jgi:nitrite reductase/ring-hydroxylating ferredoxin subunit/uncharacterized membrane protein
MKTTAQIKGHPIHVMLIPFPIALLTAAFVADLLGALNDWPGWWYAGSYLALAGIISALVAAVPGIIDFFATIPPNSSAKKRAIYHMAVNLSAVALFFAGWLIRGGISQQRPGALVLIFEAAAIGLIVVGGWLGGTLVYRNFIGPDHRYAGAGKWKEQRVQARSGESVVVADDDELEVDQMKLLHVGDKRIVLARTDDGYVAFDDHCTHRGGSLAGGVMMCGKVQCLWHGSQFDVKTGQVKCGPAEKSIGTHKVETRDGKVHLTV